MWRVGRRKGYTENIFSLLQMPYMLHHLPSFTYAVGWLLSLNADSGRKKVFIFSKIPVQKSKRLITKKLYLTKPTCSGNKKDSLFFITKAQVKFIYSHCKMAQPQAASCFCTAQRGTSTNIQNWSYGENAKGSIFKLPYKKKGSDFDMQNKRLIPRFRILVIFHFKVLSDVSVCLHILCSI